MISVSKFDMGQSCKSAKDFILKFCKNEMRDLILAIVNLIFGIKNPRKFCKNFGDWTEIIQEHQKKRHGYSRSHNHSDDTSSVTKYPTT